MVDGKVSDQKFFGKWSKTKLGHMLWFPVVHAIGWTSNGLMHEGL